MMIQICIRQTAGSNMSQFTPIYVLTDLYLISTNIRANELNMSVEWLPLLLLIRDISGLNLVRTPIILSEEYCGLLRSFIAGARNGCHKNHSDESSWQRNILLRRTNTMEASPSSLHIEFTKIVRNEILHVQCATHNGVIPFYILVGRFKFEHSLNS
jgi:hypothetical protein